MIAGILMLVGTGLLLAALLYMTIRVFREGDRFLAFMLGAMTLMLGGAVAALAGV